MKKIIVMVVTLTCLLMMIGAAQADGQPGRIWFKSSSESGLPAFLAAMRKAGKVIETRRDIRLDNQFLAENMFLNAKENGFLNLVPAKFRTKEAYAKYVRNSVVGMKSPAMLLSYFKSKGQGPGFWLMGTTNVAQELKILKTDMSALKKSGYKVTTEQMKLVQAKITALSNELETLSQDSHIFFDLADKTDTKVTNLTTQVSAHDTSMNDLVKTVNGLADNFEILKEETKVSVAGLPEKVEEVQQQQNYIVAALTVGLLLISAFFLWLGGGYKILKSIVKTNEGVLDNQVNRINMLEEAVDDVVEMSGVEVKFDPDNSSLKSLTNLPVGEENGVYWKCSYINDEYVIYIWRTDDTPVGQVRTDIVRNANSGQFTTDAFSIKRLKTKVSAAIMAGRVPVVKKAVSAA